MSSPMAITSAAKHTGLKRTKTISITSGKGGVGKSTLISNLALKLSMQGKKVLILDGDLGMANVDVMFGCRTQNSVENVLNGDCTLADILVEVAPGVTLIPGGSGVYGLQNLNVYQKKLLLDQVGELNQNFDFLFIDTASGIDDNVLALNAAAQETLVIVTPEPASRTGAYALIKILAQKYGEDRFSIVVNMAKNETEATSTFRRLSDVAQKFLNVGLDYKGFIPMDENLRVATISQQLVVRSSPQTPASLAIQGLAEKLSGYATLPQVKGGLQFFWSHLVGVA